MRAGRPNSANFLFPKSEEAYRPSAWRNQARAKVHSRSALRNGKPIASAASGMVMRYKVAQLDEVGGGRILGRKAIQLFMHGQQLLGGRREDDV